MPNKKNRTALELWDQIFADLAKQENAALWDPNNDSSEDIDKYRLALRKAGWSDDEIQARIERDLEILSLPPKTSPAINPWAEVQLERLCNDVEAAMERLGLSSYHRVARGVEPRLGPYAAKTNVVLTDESIISVGAHMFRFCGLIARAYTRTLNLNSYLWDADDYDEKVAQNYLRESPDLIRYWLSIYLSYALSGTHVMVPFLPARKPEVLLFEQVARAMEIFAISHEYGHHHLEHGKLVSEDAYQVELEADQFALKICYEVEHVPLILENPYLSSGAGGVILLLALGTLRCVEEIVAGERGRVIATHPNAISRIDQFDSVAMLKPVEYKTLKGFRVACERVMRLVDSELLPPLRSMPAEIFKNAPLIRFGSASDLNLD